MFCNIRVYIWGFSRALGRESCHSCIFKGSFGLTKTWFGLVKSSVALRTPVELTAPTVVSVYGPNNGSIR